MSEKDIRSKLLDILSYVLKRKHTRETPNRLYRVDISKRAPSGFTYTHVFYENDLKKRDIIAFTDVTSVSLKNGFNIKLYYRDSPELEELQMIIHNSSFTGCVDEVC